MLTQATGLKVGKLTSDFVANVVIMPLETPLLLLSSGEGRHTADKAFVKTIVVGDKDRPQTQFDKQERHTVAWTLLRKSMTALAGRTVMDVIQYFIHAFSELKSGIENSASSKEALVAYNMVMGPGNNLLESAINIIKSPTPPPQMTTSSSIFTIPPPSPAAVPISIWQLLISNLIKVYIQAYQLSSSATIKSGESVGDKEASHMRTLENANTLAGKKGKITDFKPLNEAAWGLIDLEGDPEVMSIEDYYFSIQHLVSLLKLKFPHLMNSYQTEMLAPIVKKPLTDDHQDYMIVMGYPDVKTVGQMLELYEFDIKSKAIEGFKFVGRDVKKDDFTLPTISTYGVATQFNAHVALVPGENTTAPKSGSSRTSQLMGGSLLKTTVNAYGPDELDIRSIAISNVDRRLNSRPCNARTPSRGRSCVTTLCRIPTSR